MKAWLQRHHWIHTWGKWTVGDIVAFSQLFGNKVEAPLQKRECSVCGLMVTRKLI